MASLLLLRAGVVFCAINLLMPIGVRGADSRQPVQANRAQGLPEFTGLAERLAPVVVNVSTRAKVSRQQAPTAPFGENDPLAEFWRRFFGLAAAQAAQSRNIWGRVLLSTEAVSL